MEAPNFLVSARGLLSYYRDPFLHSLFTSRDYYRRYEGVY